MNQLRQMSVFAHIVEAGSISGAADALDLSKSVVSQHLKALELELGLTLLKRTTRRQVLTSAGEHFYHRCKSLNEIANSAWTEAQQRKEVPQGRVRITAPNALMETLITPVIGRLIQQYPLLEPELVSSDDQLDFYEHNIDLAIRVGQSKDSNLKQRRLGEFRDVLCGVPSILSDTDLVDLNYISNSWQGRKIHHVFRNQQGDEKEYHQEARCLTNSFHSCLSLVKSGAGIGLIPDFYLPFVEPSLVEILPDYQLPPNTIYALNPFVQHVPMSVNVCIKAIEEQLRALVVNG
ncbi:transcriptional regulator [Vibrio sp. 10N.286.49.C2]|uniref:LysR family transcriptional regulator n=1 Tax=unclassified Vibrio TaxID=2614977 RepID=UPI000C85F63F|nr:MULTISPECIES: LysR family transcriptional regulator [unclassified Vibrio]PMH35201.1 transcriptional regulator [Vibrio sp. 10N.286.49.C2]PMH57144.1 transcriptional regulator [Vibrio sp. 10N.286.49.B1]PMH82344.1 transcriptional regulator [Vibrio sp. 10N.286.48.B7]